MATKSVAEYLPGSTRGIPGGIGHARAIRMAVRPDGPASVRHRLLLPSPWRF